MSGKIPRPKAGWTPGKYKYMEPYNPLEKSMVKSLDYMVKRQNGVKQHDF